MTSDPEVEHRIAIIECLRGVAAQYRSTAVKRRNAEAMIAEKLMHWQADLLDEAAVLIQSVPLTVKAEVPTS